jgi:hypothetical protein
VTVPPTRCGTAETLPAPSETAILLYRATCPKCTRASAAIVAISCNRVRRIPIDSPEALCLYDVFGEPLGKLALLSGAHFRTGWRVLPSIAHILLRGILRPPK